MNKLKTTKGITLIALVITIIVLLILAGASIAMLTGDNGILTQASKAKTETDYKGAEEKVKLAIMGARADDGQMTIEELTREVGLQGGSTTATAFPAEVQMDGYTFTVDNTGKITGNENGENEPDPKPEEPSDKPTIPTSESYVGYYADIEGDGIIDGIIYADLAVGRSGVWNNDSVSSYEYAQVTEGLKSYSISSENGTGFGNWEKPIVTEIKGTTGKNRFYVMALEDFNSGASYYWYNSADGKLDNLVGSSENDFGQGKTNTTTMIAEWNKGESGKYGAQNEQDMWGVIQKADNEEKTWELNKWFVPSKAEWAAFGDMTYTKMGVTTSNYANYGLEDYYWSSSQASTRNAFNTIFKVGYVTTSKVIGSSYIRLSTIF